MGGHVARMGEMRDVYTILVVNQRDNFEDLDVDGRDVTEWVLEREDGKVWIGFIWLRIGTSGGLL